MTGLDKLRFYSVKVNNGSGCLFQPETKDYSYILTAKHLIKKNKPIKIIRNQLVNVRLSKEEIDILGEPYPHPDKNKDAVIITIPRIEKLDDLLRIDPLDDWKKENYFLSGHPNCRRDQKDSFRPDEVTFFNSKEFGYIEIEIKSRPTFQEIEGMSGGGIIKVENGSYYLAGIQKRMVVEDKKELLGRLEIIPITFYEEIISHYSLAKIKVPYVWCIEQTKLAIKKLGNRYTPELNVELEIIKIFNGIARDELFEKQINEIFDVLIIKSKKIISNQEKLNPIFKEFNKLINQILELFKITKFIGIDPIPYNDFEVLLKKIQDQSAKIYKYLLEQKSKLEAKKEKSFNTRDYNYDLNRLEEFDESLFDFLEFISSATGRLSNNPILLLDGGAGMGKSHLLADIVSHRNIEGKRSLFFLGQRFVTDEDPWTQILKEIKNYSTENELLADLNAKGERNGSRVIIFIDAINEGRGRYFWRLNIINFIEQVLRNKWIGLVFSVRTSYKEYFFPKKDFPQAYLVQYTHFGFSSVIYEASKIFFFAAGIELPSIPLLHPEFQNPLFLKTFCDGLKNKGLTRIPNGLQGLTSINEFYIDSVNEKLAEKFDYPVNINLVRKAIDFIIREININNIRHIPYESSYVSLDRMLNDYTNKRGFLDELISEGLFSKNLFWKSATENEEGIYLTYERFQDYLSVSLFFEKYTDIKASFKSKGELFYLIKDEQSCAMNKGLIEALSIQMPERIGKDFYEIVPEVKDCYAVVDAFVQSLLWRKEDSITKKCLSYINEFVFSYKLTYDLFWDTIISVTANPKHFFNANFLHNHLMKFKLPERDAWWTIYLKDKFHNEDSVKRLIDWAWSDSDKAHISDESIKLSSITLAWFHISTNRKLRDSATKALVSLLENRLHILILLLKEFEKVDDPYVYERIFAVAYGCALRTLQRERLTDLSLYIYETVFNRKGEIYPHILLRDYARGVIEYTIYLGYKLKIDTKKIRPPYISSYPKTFPTLKAIDKKYQYDYKSKNFKDYYWGQNSILHSMTTEYGRGVASYGDFGRYVFESGLRTWKIDTNKFSNYVVQLIFEKYGYDVEKHGAFDKEIGSGRGRDSIPNERIGKKYQWSAFYEILARVSDNCKKYDEWSFRKQEELYEGPWNPYVRDIDPTLLIKQTVGKRFNQTNYKWLTENYNHWNFTSKTWLQKSNDLPKINKIINTMDEHGDEWLVLDGSYEWVEPKELGNEKWDVPQKRVACDISSYLINTKDYNDLRKWMIKQDLFNTRLPESPNRYEVFSREYYVCAAYQYFKKKSYASNDWHEISLDKKQRQSVVNVMITSENFLWEEGFDYSKEAAIFFLKPCFSIFKGMNLRYSNKEGEFVNELGSLVCFDPSVNNDFKSALLVKKKEFLKYLEENNLKIIWVSHGEKIILGGKQEEYLGRLEFSGTFYISNLKVQGKFNSIKFRTRG